MSNDPYDVTKMNRNELLLHRKAQLDARTDGQGRPRPGYAVNVIALQDEIENLEQLKDETDGK